MSHRTAFEALDAIIGRFPFDAVNESKTRDREPTRGGKVEQYAESLHGLLQSSLEHRGKPSSTWRFRVWVSESFVFVEYQAKSWRKWRCEPLVPGWRHVDCEHFWPPLPTDEEIEIERRWERLDELAARVG